MKLLSLKRLWLLDEEPVPFVIPIRPTSLSPLKQDVHRFPLFNFACLVGHLQHWGIVDVNIEITKVHSPHRWLTRNDSCWLGIYCQFQRTPHRRASIVPTGRDDPNLLSETDKAYETTPLTALEYHIFQCSPAWCEMSLRSTIPVVVVYWTYRVL